MCQGRSWALRIQQDEAGPAAFLTPLTALFPHVAHYGHRKPGTRLPDRELREEKGDVPFVTLALSWAQQGTKRMFTERLKVLWPTGSSELENTVASDSPLFPTSS